MEGEQPDDSLAMSQPSLLGPLLALLPDDRPWLRLAGAAFDLGVGFGPMKSSAVKLLASVVDDRQ